ncbi:MAG: hypothetical protein GXO23_00760 [Crenarchaeota archaeon]|nr:hypothetical protein [Thermoproteota archaeon]
MFSNDLERNLTEILNQLRSYSNIVDIIMNMFSQVQHQPAIYHMNILFCLSALGLYAIAYMKSSDQYFIEILKRLSSCLNAHYKYDIIHGEIVEIDREIENIERQLERGTSDNMLLSKLKVLKQDRALLTLLCKLLSIIDFLVSRNSEFEKSFRSFIEQLLADPQNRDLGRSLMYGLDRYIVEGKVALEDLENIIGRVYEVLLRARGRES